MLYTSPDGTSEAWSGLFAEHPVCSASQDISAVVSAQVQSSAPGFPRANA